MPTEVQLKVPWKRASSWVKISRFVAVLCVRHVFSESRSLELDRKEGGKFHLKLNTSLRLIANKYPEGKMKRTLERELNVLEIAELETKGTNDHSEIAARIFV